MTYKLEPWIEKISSSITVCLPDGKHRRYINGQAVAKDSFDKHYIIKNISSVSNEIVLTLTEVITPATSWIGEEQQSFF